MNTEYVITFARIALGLLFTYSFSRKVIDVTNFALTIENFRLLPQSLSRLVAKQVLLVELVCVVLIFIGGSLLGLAFFLSAMLLSVFSLVLTVLIFHKREVSCNCLGTSEKSVSFYDVIRNAGFLVCSLFGLYFVITSNNSGVVLKSGELALVGTMAVIFVAVWTQIGEILDILRSI